MMIIKNKKNNSGFVLLFTVMLSSIILAISLGVANVAFKEIRFGTSAKDTNDAFFAADVGAECALFNDKLNGNSFIESGGTGQVQCLGRSIDLLGDYPDWSFVLSGLGPQERSCAKVTVDKIANKFISKGYNVGGEVLDSCTPGHNSVERELELSY